MPARCSGCGGTVMPYRRYALHLRRTATCDNCGKKVRIRRRGVLGMAAFFFVGFSWAYFVDRVGVTAWSVGVLLALAVAVHWWSWHAFQWDIVDEGSKAE